MQTALAGRSPRCVVLRYGAIGDYLMAASVLPGLKRQGFHITFETDELGEEILRHDPNIDAIHVTPTGSVDLDKLPAYWNARTIGVERVVNLVGSVEGLLLKPPNQGDFYWRAEALRGLCDRNYVETQHLIAGVPYTGSRQMFYPSPEERAWAASYAAEHGPLVFWVLAGSAHHKLYPWAPSAIVQLLYAHPDCGVVLSGDENSVEMAKSLMDSAGGYYGTNSAHRLHVMVGTHSIRESLALASASKVVVGPETAALNAVAMLPMRKVVMLSHSSGTNLTRDWTNTVSISADPAKVPCSPCHRLHRGDAPHCPRHEASGAAQCAAAILPESLIAPVLDGLAQ